MSVKGISIGILIGILVIIIIYVIAMFECYKNRTFIFTPYTPKAPPSEAKAFYPLGTITALTPEQITERNNIINASIAGLNVAS